MKKKLALTITSIALVAAVAIGGTLAWITSAADPVVNTFTIGAGISITLDEAKVANNEIDPSATARVIENDYTYIPGATADKDPTIHLDANSDSSYLYAFVENQMGVFATPNIDTTKWAVVETVDNGTVYRWAAGPVAGDPEGTNDYAIFTELTFAEYNMADLPDGVTKPADNATITVKALAHQATGVTVEEANTAATNLFFNRDIATPVAE